jgi:hypothetical protein
MRANLYVVDANGATLVDGNLTNYNSIYSNTIDIDDAWKMTNPGINFGIKREGYDIVVERRNIIDLRDTTFFRMWNMPQHNYRIKFMLKNLNHTGLNAALLDKYLNTETTIGLNDTTYVDFTINANPASANQMRFELIYTTYLSAPVDISFTGIQVQRKGKDVLVEWGIANEVSMESYTVQRSTDGRNYSDLQQVAPYNTQVSKTYSYKDIGASGGDNFYRIKALSTTGKIQISPVAKLNSIASAQSIIIYPNPVVNKIVQIQFNNQPAGKYSISLIYSNGILQQLATIQMNTGQNTQSINLPQNLAKGIYQLQVVGPDNQRTVKDIQVL